MKTNRTLKIVGTVALVGTLAALAVLGLTLPSSGSSTGSTFLASKIDPEITLAFNNFITSNRKSYLTHEEFNARLANFRDNFEKVKQHNANTEASYKLSMNKFSDWTQKEINNYLSFRQPMDTDEDSTGENQAVPHQ